MLPIVHIDKLAEELGVSRRWINENWIASDNPPPHFEDGKAIFFEIEELKTWAKRRSLGCVSTATPTGGQ